jgi:hypothetical protein
MSTAYEYSVQQTHHLTYPNEWGCPLERYVEHHVLYVLRVLLRARFRSEARLCVHNKPTLCVLFYLIRLLLLLLLLRLNHYFRLLPHLLRLLLQLPTIGVHCLA